MNIINFVLKAQIGIKEVYVSIFVCKQIDRSKSFKISNDMLRETVKSCEELEFSELGKLPWPTNKLTVKAFRTLTRHENSFAIIQSRRLTMLKIQSRNRIDDEYKSSIYQFRVRRRA